MEQFSAAIFFTIGEILGKFENDSSFIKIADDRFRQSFMDLANEALPALIRQCENISLNVSTQLLKELKSKIDEKEIKIADVASRLKSLGDTIRIEMTQNVFMYLPTGRAGYYAKNNPFGDPVANSFSSATFDITEAGNCFAAGRWTACVFHLMRVLEIGLITFAKLFPKVSIERENWQLIIDQIETEIREMPKPKIKESGWRQKHEDYSQAANNFRSFKNAWRNYTAHARGKYTDEEAEGIYRNVKSFMQHLAKLGLEEQTKGIAPCNASLTEPGR